MNQRWLFLSGLVDPMPHPWAPPPAASWAPGASPPPLASPSPWPPPPGGGVGDVQEPPHLTTAPLLSWCPGGQCCRLCSTLPDMCSADSMLSGSPSWSSSLWGYFKPLPRTVHEELRGPLFIQVPINCPPTSCGLQGGRKVRGRDIYINAVPLAAAQHLGIFSVSG